MTTRALLFLGCMCTLATPAHAGSSASQRQAAARAEAQDLVDGIWKGEGNLNAQLSRAQFLGVEGIVSLELSELTRRATDDAQLRRIAQSRMHVLHSPELGMTMADGGRPVEEQDDDEPDRN